MSPCRRQIGDSIRQIDRPPEEIVTDPTQRNGSYPCPAPFSQLYMVPRALLDLRFCSYHEPVFVRDQEAFFKEGPEALQRFFEGNQELRRRRDAYLKGDYEKAGCPSGCFWFQKWKTTGKGFSREEFEDADRRLHVKRLWLSVGPDCNVTCRYCLEPKEFHIDFKTCSPSVMGLAEEFVARGNSILLTGGEPFMSKFKLLPTLERLAARSQDGMGYFDIHTNGTYLDQNCRALILRAPVNVINVSMDTLRPELFEYLRRGCKFDKVWKNVNALVRERNDLGLKKPVVIILCAVMRDTWEHIEETVQTVVDHGMGISLNALFKGYYSPDFCREQALTNLSQEQLLTLERTVASFETRYGKSGPVHYQGFLGQVRDLIEAKGAGNTGKQVALGDGGQARRKQGVIGLVLKGKPRLAVREAINLGAKAKTRLMATIRGL